MGYSEQSEHQKGIGLFTRYHDIVDGIPFSGSHDDKVSVVDQLVPLLEQVNILRRETASYEDKQERGDRVLFLRHAIVAILLLSDAPRYADWIGSRVLRESVHSEKERFQFRSLEKALDEARTANGCSTTPRDSFDMLRLEELARSNISRFWGDQTLWEKSRTSATSSLPAS